MPMSREIAISTHGLSKNYGGVTGLSPMNLEIYKGDIHGLVGQNGAGKSTFLKIISGAQSQTKGTFDIFGEEVTFNDPHKARLKGVATVFQELSIMPNLNVLENIFLSDPKMLKSRWIQDSERMLEAYEELANEVGSIPDPFAIAGSLSIADQQFVEICRAINLRSDIILFDEPTASLSASEKNRFAQIIQTLKERLITVVLISHDLEEILLNCDKISVFRDGSLIESRDSANWNKAQLVSEMLGEKKDQIGSLPHAADISHSRSILIEELKTSIKSEPINFDLREGEILGIAGLVGSGRTRLMRALAGLNPHASGYISFDGVRRNIPTSPLRAKSFGIALAPEDRKGQGLVLGLSVAENLILANWKIVSRFVFIMKKKFAHQSNSLRDSVGIKSASLNLPVSSLSGGNQQKVLLGKWMNTDLSVFLIDEPTRGVDVHGKKEVYALLKKMAQRGVAIILVSSEFEELFEVCDRIIPISKGQLSEPMVPVNYSLENLLSVLYEEKK